ncbi:hypothetical protein [Stakelama saccharophila]|uniref:Uncharacterized protein n=1 Tax=Stakelama saccharophila TaxID=3075605 RepID=A0ABZ0B6L1_9SPHN|nr:hypothetical protein [Stakelama sp. W311]WNO53047.1 hypothetical protein RPR59_11345 [Stakelama sp. W311]
MKFILVAAASLAFSGAAVAQTADTQTTSTATTTTDQDPTGGYEPSTPPLSAQPAAGQEVIFQPSVSPDQAFPAPAPQEDYPVCEPGQYDNCIQRGAARR